MTFFYIILANVVISALSIFLAYLLSRLDKNLSRINIYLISLSAGTILGGAFLHLLPEALKVGNAQVVMFVAMLAILIFLAMEKFLNWHHCHESDCEVHSFGYMNLIGDAFHNFLDGVIIATAFMIDIRLGIITTFAVMLHEIPQELGDFGVLIHAGFSKNKAILLNLLVSFTSIIGATLAYLFIDAFTAIQPYLLAFAAGGFIYISTSDLIPELRKKENKSRTLNSYLTLCTGVLIMSLFLFFE